MRIAALMATLGGLVTVDVTAKARRLWPYFVPRLLSIRPPSPHQCRPPRPTNASVRIVKDGLEDAPASKLYVTSVYWTVTTLSTVGYGDIFASTIAERTYCILVSFVLVGAPQWWRRW